MPDFPIIDAHVHLYDPTWLRYGWLRQVPPIDCPHGIADFDSAAGPVAVEAIVFIEVAADAGLHLAEAAWVQAIADREPRLQAIVAHLPVERGAAVEADIERLLANRCLRGVRRLIQGEVDPAMCLEPGFIEGVRRVGAHGLTFDLCIKHWQLGFAVELVRRCPGTRFVLDHIGKPGIRHGFIEPWRAQMAELARLPNVDCKLSGVITEADPTAWTPATLLPYLDHVLQTFGPERVLFGSDWSVSSLTHAYPEWVAIVEATVAPGGGPALRQVFSQTARRVYRL